MTGATLTRRPSKSRERLIPHQKTTPKYEVPEKGHHDRSPTKLRQGDAGRPEGGLLKCEVAGLADGHMKQVK